jgi:RHS repeat-associated protein
VSYAPALGKADITTATDYNPFGMLMPGRMVEDNSVQCIPVSKTRLVNQIEYLDDMVNPDAPGTTGPVVSFQSPGNATITYPTNIDNDIYVLAEPNPVDGTNMDVFADLLVLPSGAVGLTIDTRVEEDNSPIYNAGATPAGSGTTTVRLQRIVNGSVADDLTTVYVVGTDDAFLSAEDLNPGDSIRVSFQYQGVPANPAPPTPPNPPVTPPGAMIVIPRVIYSVITKAPQTYVAMSCDTDGNYTANYRYGFNGQQKDEEIKGQGNSLNFGARMHDSRLGRWLSLDPMKAKFPSQSTYDFAINNPILLIDKEGKEPNKAQATGLNSLIQILTDNNIQGLSDLSVLYGGWGSRQTAPVVPERYLYSEKWGWIDMRHFASAAAASDMIYATGHGVLSHSETIESQQAWNTNLEERNSAYDYEDLVSNLLGVYFEVYLESDAAKDKSFMENLNNYLQQLGFTSSPASAPNYNQLEETMDTDSGETNTTYAPSHTTKPRDGNLDKKITQYLDLYLFLSNNESIDRASDEDKAKLGENANATE